MKIIQVTRQFYPAVGGIETVVFQLSQALIRMGHRVDVVTLNRQFGAAGLLPAEDVLNGINIHRIPYIGSSRYAVAPGVINKLDDADLIHLHSSDFFLDYLAFTRIFHRKPMVLHPHGLYFHSAYARGAKKIYLHTITRLALRQVSAIICASQHDIDLLKRVAPGEKLVFIPIGVDSELLTSAEGSRDPDMILSVGRLSGNKRGHLLLKALAIVLKEKPDARLVFIGKDQGELEGLKHLAESLGISAQVKFMGEVSPEILKDHLSRAQVWVSASEYESFGIAALEAMASGCVPVVQRLAAFEDFIQDQYNGFFTDFTDSGLAASTILHVLKMNQEKHQNVSSQAKETAACFTWEAIAAKIEKIYQKALSNSHQE